MITDLEQFSFYFCTQCKNRTKWDLEIIVLSKDFLFISPGAQLLKK